METGLQLSVVIPTYNRCDVLVMALDRLEGQSLPPGSFEIIVVDDGSSDHTPALIEEWQRKLSRPLRYFRHENRGPGYTQNRGILAAQAELVVIIADDILATERMLEEHLRMHARNPRNEIAVLGKATQSETLPQTVFQRNWDPFRYDKLAGKSELPSYCFFGCNISFKKKFLVKNGLFLERQGAAHEDIELGYRLGRKGLRILYCEQALGFHHHLDTFASACRRAYERGWNFDLLSEHVPKEFIFPIYSILTLDAGLQAFVRMLPREVMRGLVFNGMTVSFFWRPILARAETNTFAAFFANPITYRGTVNYYLRAGYWDKKDNESKGGPFQRPTGIIRGSD